MPKTTRVFYAFPSKPPALPETITNAIELLKRSPDIRRDRIRILPWTDLDVGGKRLVRTILGSIDRADVFACDLTYPNHNVSFELGYAIGQFKRVWISLDPSIEGAELRFRRIYFGLLGSGYVKYNNSNDLTNAFLDENPVRDLDQTLLGDPYRRPMARQETPILFYLKPPINTDAVVETTEALYGSIFGDAMLIDDPLENPSPTLDWYAGNLNMADAVVCHLLGHHQTGHEDHNVKCSLIAGLARGFQKNLLMVAEKPFESPVDYQDLISLHETAHDCKFTVVKWSEDLALGLSARRPRRRELQPTSQQSVDLRSLTIGEPVAENERQRLDNYFVETSTYFRALDDPVTIVVGRRGVGKSAQLYAMQAALRSDKRNHVCVIKPVGYEIDGLVRVLKSILGKSERGYLIESLWKFLIYSEVCRSIYQALGARPLYIEPTGGESAVIEYYESHTELLAPPFSERLDVAVRSLADLVEIDDAIHQRQRISERLHSSQLRELRDVLGKALSTYERVNILIDNLDGQWGNNENIETVSELLWGLLQVSDDIVSEFQIHDHWRTAANVNLTVFLRSDIFAFIQPTAPEQDKLPIQRIVWDDPEILKRMIDLRLRFGSDSSHDSEVIWDRLFPETIVGVSAWEFVRDTVLPRPRDIVYMMREAIDGAINRGHLAVEPQDFLEAREKYSEYAFRSILAEDDPRKGKLEPIMYEFAGCPKIITRCEIDDKFAAAGVDPQDYDFYVDLLCDVNFLAISSNNGYQYAKHEADRQIKRRIAAQIAKSNDSYEAYQVSSAFWQVLQIES